MWPLYDLPDLPPCCSCCYDCCWIAGAALWFGPSSCCTALSFPPGRRMIVRTPGRPPADKMARQCEMVDRSLEVVAVRFPAHPELVLPVAELPAAIGHAQQQVNLPDRLPMRPPPHPIPHCLAPPLQTISETYLNHPALPGKAVLLVLPPFASLGPSVGSQLIVTRTTQARFVRQRVQRQHALELTALRVLAHCCLESANIKNSAMQYLGWGAWRAGFAVGARV